ncbi:unnamed protein product [Rhizophagus irregularis]|nr:unnamed protein product [Rhizophagus irregularis]
MFSEFFDFLLSDIPLRIVWLGGLVGTTLCEIQEGYRNVSIAKSGNKVYGFLQNSRGIFLFFGILWQYFLNNFLFLFFNVNLVFHYCFYFNKL